jgi:hypothetical protein
VFFQRQQEAGTQDHWDLVDIQIVQRKFGHKECHCASMPEREYAFMFMGSLCGENKYKHHDSSSEYNPISCA